LSSDKEKLDKDYQSSQQEIIKLSKKLTEVSKKTNKKDLIKQADVDKQIKDKDRETEILVR